MQPDWQSWLTQNGAVVERGAVQHFGDPAHEGRAAANGPCIADLSHQPVIRAYGVDTEKILQGQLTNDVRQHDGRRSQLSAYCSPKGRALAIMRLFRRGEAYCLLLPASLLEPTLNRLRKYVLMSKVTLEAARAGGPADRRGRMESPRHRRRYPRRLSRERGRLRAADAQPRPAWRHQLQEGLLHRARGGRAHALSRQTQAPHVPSPLPR